MLLKWAVGICELGLNKWSNTDDYVLVGLNLQILPSPTTGAFAAQALNWKANSTRSSQNQEDVHSQNYSDFTFQTQSRPSDVSSTMFPSSMPSFPTVSILNLLRKSFWLAFGLIAYLFVDLKVIIKIAGRAEPAATSTIIMEYRRAEATGWSLSTIQIGKFPGSDTGSIWKL